MPPCERSKVTALQHPCQPRRRGCVAPRDPANMLQTNREKHGGRIGTANVRFGSTSALAGHVGTGWTPVE